MQNLKEQKHKNTKTNKWGERKGGGNNDGRRLSELR